MTKAAAPHSHDKGLWAESFAALILRCRGYRILARRYKTPVGEIDLIARKGAVIAFIEVKARASLDDALAAVTPRMQSRIARAALHFQMLAPETQRCDLRFDLFAITPPFRWRHLDNAWRPPT